MDNIKIIEYNSPKGRIIYGVGNTPLSAIANVNSNMVVSGIKVSMIDSIYHITISYEDGGIHEIYAKITDVEIYRRNDSKNYELRMSVPDPESYKPIKI